MSPADAAALARNAAQIVQGSIDVSPEPHQVTLAKAWAAKVATDLLIVAQTLERIQPAPSLFVPLTLAAAGAFWAGLSAGWIIWGL